MGIYKVEYIEKNYIETSLDSYKNNNKDNETDRQMKEIKRTKRQLIKKIERTKNFDDVKYIYTNLNKYNIKKLKQIYKELN